MIVTAVFFCVCLPSDIPIFMIEELIAQEPNATQRERKALPKGGIARCPSITDQRYASFIRVFNPHIVSLEGRQRADGVRIRQKIGCRTSPQGLSNKAGEVCCS